MVGPVLLPVGVRLGSLRLNLYRKEHLMHLFHKWSKWEFLYPLEIYYNGKYERTVAIYGRECDTCGLVKKRRIKS